MMRNLKSILRNSKGATAIEYGLIAALIAVAAIGSLEAVGTAVTASFNNASANL
jgi:pilus assembly protein Flp/PilA